MKIFGCDSFRYRQLWNPYPPPKRDVWTGYLIPKDLESLAHKLDYKTSSVSTKMSQYIFFEGTVLTEEELRNLNHVVKQGT